MWSPCGSYAAGCPSGKTSFSTSPRWVLGLLCSCVQSSQICLCGPEVFLSLGSAFERSSAVRWHTRAEQLQSAQHQPEREAQEVQTHTQSHTHMLTHSRIMSGFTAGRTQSFRRLIGSFFGGSAVISGAIKSEPQFSRPLTDAGLNVGRLFPCLSLCLFLFHFFLSFSHHVSQWWLLQQNH